MAGTSPSGTSSVSGNVPSGFGVGSTASVGEGAGDGRLAPGSSRLSPMGTMTARTAAAAMPVVSGGTAASDGAGLALDEVQGQGCAVPVVDLGVELAGQLGGQAAVGGVVHRSSSRGFSVWGARSRRVASARLAWDFTVPTEMPRVSAVSASESSS